MSEKYTGLIGRFHLFKEGVKERWANVKEAGGLGQSVKSKTNDLKEGVIRKINHGEQEYDHIYRRKTRWELIRISAAVMGIEFSYAAETAFVSPTLLKIGVRHEHMTMIWCLSPLVGFFLTPIMGSLSDRCGSSLGRRRPFILVLSVGVVLGLLLVPNGKWLGEQLGDRYPGEEALVSLERSEETWGHQGPGGRLYAYGQVDDQTRMIEQLDKLPMSPANSSSLAEQIGLPLEHHHSSHPWGIFFTILGTVLLDFDADSCQSPSRAYLLDVTVPADHAVGLSTFTIMAGLGGSLGYAMGAFDWGWLGRLFGGHVRLVFTLVLFLFIGCVAVSVMSFPEIPLSVMEASKETIKMKRRRSSQYHKFTSADGGGESHGMTGLPSSSSVDGAVGGAVGVTKAYGSFDSDVIEEDSKKHVRGNPFVREPSISSQYSTTHNDTSDNNLHHQKSLTEEDKRYLQVAEKSLNKTSPIELEDGVNGAKAHFATLTQYLWSILYMPNSLRILCLTNLFCWMSLVCYSLYFTDFVGEAVFKGDPSADPGSEKRILYDEGVRFGCWGMCFYSFSCSCYSFIIERLVSRFRAKPVYIGGQLVYCVGMIFMALTQSKWGVLVFSWSAGVMYSTLFTMPYLLVAYYHETDVMYTADSKGSPSSSSSQPVRGLGTDIGIVSCMVFLAQFILSLSMGSIIAACQSTVAVIVAAAVLSLCGAITANFVSYLDL